MLPSLKLAQKLFIDSNKGYWVFLQNYLKLLIYYIRSFSILSERELIEHQIAISLTLLDKLLTNIHSRNIYLQLEEPTDLNKEHYKDKIQIKELLQTLKLYLKNYQFLSEKNKEICLNKIEQLLKYFDTYFNKRKIIVVDNSHAPKPMLKYFCAIHNKKN